jgi:glucokinase
MLPFREVFYAKKIEPSKICFLVGDIGGTNSNFGIVEPHNDTFTLLLSLHFKSSEIKNFPDLIADIISYLNDKYSLTITKACLGAAGIISELRDWAKPTNLHFEIDAKKIKEKTGLATVVLINDFEAVGFGIEKLAKKDLVHLNNGAPRAYANKAILGAGTGLGKGIMAWDEPRHTYIPVPSEGGHADFAVQSQQELDFINFIKTSEHIPCNISWENILSGRGIQRIYSFLGSVGSYQSTQYTQEIEKNGLHPDMIFGYRMHDERCKDTFELFAGWYGRCAKNFTLDVLALGGMYIAGGIASKNLDLFKVPHFMGEFVNCGKQMQRLKDVPVYVISDYNVSLYGAAQYLMLRHI